MKDEKEGNKSQAISLKVTIKALKHCKILRN
jgi:hypothetical protein